MSITNSNAIAKVAAFVAGAGLVAMSFAPLAKAQTTADLQAQIASLQAMIATLQAQLGQSSSASATFTRDLTIGSTGADVTSLQTWLISKGYAIPAGATGYFGAQTQAALAAFQAANGIAPAAGYFGPITRAKVNAMAGGTVTTGGGTTTPGTLSGGEANLSGFNLIAEDGTLRESSSDEQLATAEFDVKDGDVDIQRLDLEVQASDTSLETHPWKYIDSVTVWDGSTKLATVDTSSQSDWDDNNTDTDLNSSGAKRYKVSVTGFHDVVKEGDTADLTISVDTVSSIDSNDTAQTFDVRVPTDGIRAVDGMGIQNYTGDDSDTVNIDVSAAQNGDLTVKENTDDPEAGTIVADQSDISPAYSVFKFDIKNSDDVDTKVTDLTFSVATGSGVGSGLANITDAVRKATLDFGGDTYTGDVNSDNTIDFTDMSAVVAANETETGEVMVELYSDDSASYGTSESLLFSLAHGNVTAENADNGDSVAGSDISGTATGNAQAIIVTAGVTIAGGDMSGTTTYNSTTPTSSYATFTLDVDITAVGDDVYVPKIATTTAATFGKAASSTYAGFVIDTALVASTTDSVVTTTLTTSADSDSTYFYVVHEGDTETFTITAVINPKDVAGDTNTFEVGLDKVKFDTAGTNLNSLSTVDVDQTQNENHSDTATISI